MSQKYLVLRSWGSQIKLNEPSYGMGEDDKAYPLDEDLKIKLQKLLKRRRGALALVLSKWDVNQESRELRESMEAIISLTATSN